MFITTMHAAMQVPVSHQ